MKSAWALLGLTITLAWLSLCGSPVRADDEPLADLRALEQFRQQALAKVDRPLVELGAKYQAALEKRAASAQMEGNLETVLEVKGEIKRIEEDEAKAPELKDAEAAKLRSIYLDAHNKLIAEIRPRRVIIDRKHAEELGTLVTRLTKAGMLEDAKRVRGLQQKILEQLGNGAPVALQGVVGSAKPGSETPPELGRFVRIDLPTARGTLNLAEVQVFSFGKNIAPQGEATQSSTYTRSRDASAKNAIDGSTEGNFKTKMGTHTKWEKDPWWELDLGEEKGLFKIMIWNRTGTEASRLDGFKLSVLNEKRKTVWRRTYEKAPTKDLAIDLGRTPASRAHGCWITNSL